MLAVVSGVAIDVSGAVGGGVVVAVASGADLTVFVPACSLATATAPMSTTALAPITADSNLTFFCWSTLTTPFGPGLSATRRSVPLRKGHSTYVAYPQKGHSKRAALALPGGGPNTVDASTAGSLRCSLRGLNDSAFDGVIPCMRSLETIDRELKFIAGARTAIRQLGGHPSTHVADELLDERLALGERDILVGYENAAAFEMNPPA